jgi:hypothetical protein
MSLSLRADIEERLRGLANAQGISLDMFLERIVAEKSGAFSKPRLGADEWWHQFEEWADSFPAAPPISDEGLRRASLYPDR